MGHTQFIALGPQERNSSVLVSQFSPGLSPGTSAATIPRSNHKNSSLLSTKTPLQSLVARTHPICQALPRGSLNPWGLSSTRQLTKMPCARASEALNTTSPARTAAID
jgi:hypothetical protein